MDKQKLHLGRLFLLFLLLVLLFSLMFYIYLTKDSFLDQMSLAFGAGEVFAKSATYSVLNLSNSQTGFDKHTYEIELEVHKQVNTIRLDSSLSPLIWDPMLAKLAREHAYDMAQYKYVNHTNLAGQDIELRAKRLGVKFPLEIRGVVYEGFGENIGFMPQGIVEGLGVIITSEDVASAQVLSWMLSEGHRKNILFKDYFFTGVGVAYDGAGAYYLVQVFQ